MNTTETDNTVKCTYLSHFFPDSKQSSMSAQCTLLKPIQGPLGKFHSFLKNCYKPPTFSVKSVAIMDDKLKTDNWTCFKTGWHLYQTWVISNSCWVVVWHTSKVKGDPVLFWVVYMDSKQDVKLIQCDRTLRSSSVTGCYAHPVWQDVNIILCDRMLILSSHQLFSSVSFVNCKTNPFHILEFAKLFQRYLLLNKISQEYKQMSIVSKHICMHACMQAHTHTHFGYNNYRPAVTSNKNENDKGTNITVLHASLHKKYI